MLRGNPPSQHLFFSISFPSLFKKKSENFRGGFEPPEPPPLKYALASSHNIIVYTCYKKAVGDANRPMGSNIAHFRDKHGIEVNSLRILPI